MAERPEVTIQAILAGLRDMHQLNLRLVDCIAVEALLGGGHQGELVQWGRTRKEAQAKYLKFTGERLTFERGRDRWGDFPVRF